MISSRKSGQIPTETFCFKAAVLSCNGDTGHWGPSDPCLQLCQTLERHHGLLMCVDLVRVRSDPTEEPQLCRSSSAA